MSPEAITAERIYRDLHMMIINAELAPGRQVVVHALAERFGVSISPVRDALNRLLGRGLVENHAGGGFAIVGYTVASARALYAWQLDVVRSILNAGKEFSVLDRPPAALNHEKIEDAFLADVTLRFFGGLAGCSPNPEHGNALLLVSERLHPLRVNEGVLPVRGVELHALWQTVQNGDRGNMLRAMTKYHRRRIMRAELIVRKTMEEA